MANLRGHDLNLVNNLKKIKKVELDNRTDKRTALKIIRDRTKLNPDVCPFREFGHLDCGGLDRYGLHKYGNKNHPMYIYLKNHVPILIQADERKNYWNDHD